MRRRILAGGIALIVLATGLVGCGIPDGTVVKVDGKGPSPGFGWIDGGERQQPKDRLASGDDVGPFALAFLRAAAGEPGGAYQRVHDFIAPGSKDQLKEKPAADVAINVVRLTDETPQVTNDVNDSTVRISVQQVGVLTAEGTLEPPEARHNEYTFTVGKVAGQQGLFVTKLPPLLLMSTDALADYYEQRAIYFWNAEKTALVPDLRYLPLAVPEGRQATDVVDWLTKGPVSWLKPAAVGLPAGTKPIGNVATVDGRLVVNLSAEVLPADDAAQLEHLATQLMWSLRPNRTEQLELKIQNQTRRVFPMAAHLAQHPVYQIADRAQLFCIAGGQVRRLVDPDNPSESAVPLSPEANANIVSAGFARDDELTVAALVSRVRDRRRLLVGASTGPAREFRSSGEYGEISRPVWLKGGHPVGLVVAGRRSVDQDGRLYHFGRDATLRPVDIPAVPAPITAVGAAPDGHRIAFIAGGALYVAALNVDQGRVEAGPPRQLPTSLRQLTAVDWSGENSLVVAGEKANGRVAVALYDITVDGGREDVRVNDLGTARVTQLAAYPSSPLSRPGTGRVMYEAAGVAYELFSKPERLTDKLAADPGSTAQPAPATPTAPFFLY